MSKSEQITYWIEIPLIVDYTVFPAERQTLTYPGCDAHIEIDQMTKPTNGEWNRIIEDETEAIELACWDDVKENDIPPDDGI